MKVSIKELTFNCIIGILPFEREKKQRVVINCSFSYKYSNGEFIDYSLVASDIEKIMKKKQFELLEEAVLHLKKKLTTKYKITKLKLSIAKPDILKHCIVTIEH